MQLTSIETTPNPNSMKLNLDTRLGPAATFVAARPEACPESLRPLLGIAGVESVFACADFVTLNRDPRASWEPILEAARRALAGQGAGESSAEEAARRAAEKLGQVTVAVQTFREVPVQVRARDAALEKRLGLDSRFARAAQSIQARVGGDYLRERAWIDRGIRYGTVEEVAATVVEEIEALLDEDALARIVADATGGTRATGDERASAATSSEPTSSHPAPTESDLASDDWRRRLRALERLGASEGAVPALATALDDPQPQVRRWAAAALGATRSADAVTPLCRALSDANVGVRRTAGDALSDLGDARARPAMTAALQDPSQLVRWRAARFLTELGTGESLPALEAVANDAEFEVRLEVAAALRRIRAGGQAAGPMWKRLTGES